MRWNAKLVRVNRLSRSCSNFLFVGHVDAGKNLAGLYSLVATCEARSINPFAYLADVIARIDEHPASKLDDLLPASWTPAA